MQAPFGPKATNRRTIPDSPGTFQRRSGLSTAAALACALAALIARCPAAVATTAQQLCPGFADPCVVDEVVAIDPDSVIALGARGLRLRGDAQLRILSGKLTLSCATLHIDASASIRSTGSRRDAPAAAIDIDAASINLAGRIDTRGSPAGSLALTAADAILVSGEILGRAEAGDASAAKVTLEAGSVTISGTVDLSGGREDVGGDLTVAATSSLILSRGASLEVSGGEGGSIDLSSGGLLRVDPGAKLDADGQTAAEDGGSVSMTAVGPLTMHGVVSATAREGDEENGAGDGGSISISSDAAVDLLQGAASIDASGGAPDGIGGDIEIESLSSSLRSAATITASVTGGDGLGGTIDLSAAAALLFLGSAEARGGSSGGDIDLKSDADASIGNDALLDASGVRSGSGGTVGLAADGALTLAGAVRADGGASDGSRGGTITARACAILMPESGVVTALEAGGRNAFACRSRCEIAGVLRADPGSGFNELRYRAAGAEPDLSGAVIVPAAQLTLDATLAPCGPVPPTATPTDMPPATPTRAASSPTPSPTPTTMPDGCPGDCNASGKVDIAELVRAVNIALERAALATCRPADRDGSGSVGIGELIAAVAAALNGCAA